MNDRANDSRSQQSRRKQKRKRKAISGNSRKRTIKIIITLRDKNGMTVEYNRSSGEVSVINEFLGLIIITRLELK